jgi:hypothetical protein
MPPILKNRNVLLAIGITIFILILVIIFSPKRTINPGNANPTPSSSSGVTTLVNLSEQKRIETSNYVSAIASKLPLYQESFMTSVGIDTTINIYRLETDDPAIVRLEIYGLSYMNKDTNPQKNPNVTAYKESYLKAISMLESVNIDPKRLIFIYGDKEYIRTTTKAWIDALQLKP